MRHAWFLVCYGEAILRALYRKSAEECTTLLGLDLCYEPDCGDRRADATHAHIPDRLFGQPQLYSPYDVERAGLRYREGLLPEIGKIRWEVWNENDPRRTLYFEEQRFIV